MTEVGFEEGGVYVALPYLLKVDRLFPLNPQF